jgi:phosphohistidine phosphatase
VRLYLVHHGDAVAPEIDPQRPLSATGRAAVGALAAAAAQRGVRPDAVWHSGKLRARQTAEILWRACNPLAEFAAVRGLQPTDPPAWIVDRLSGDTREILCIGHLPNIARLLRTLVAGRDDAPVDLPPHGLVALEADQDGTWRERWRLDPADLAIP